PLSAIEHPKFQEMIDIASRATNGVKLFGRKSARDEVIDMFTEQLSNLRARFRVSAQF
ncbi:hypothetical protein B0H14DRAFT_2368857, partial [Mycena olivaceomarginata]